MASSTTNSMFSGKNINFLRSFLKERNVPCSKLRKEELFTLCEAADELNLEIDPEGLLESRGDVIASKLLLSASDGTLLPLPLPTLMPSTNSFSNIPAIELYDITHHMSKVVSSHALLRDPRKMEGYGMYKDGFVLDLQAVEYQQNPSYSAIVGKVKPRTNAKDPTTGLPYYISWMILCNRDDQERIVSAYCTCRGGIDGFCRHITAILFELHHFFRNDENTTTCTSKPCQWVRRKTWTDQPQLPVEVCDLDTSIVAEEVSKSTDVITQRTDDDRTKSGPLAPTHSTHSGLEIEMDKFLKGLNTILPSACGLTIVMDVKASPDTPVLNVKTPTEKIIKFKKDHSCTLDCHCSQEFCKVLQYSRSDISHIESATMGQSKNSNWFEMRKNVLTSSKFKTICHSINLYATAKSLLNEKKLNEDFLPPPTQYGRGNEKRARNKFIRTHSLKHRKCNINETGLYFIETYPFLASSPDGLMNCSCGDFVIEIKCLFKFKMFSPKVAGKKQGIIMEDEMGTITINPKHDYHYQIQGQMGVTGIKQAILVLYTDRGIFDIKIPFNQQMWDTIVSKLEHFYHQEYFPMLFSNITL